MCSGESLLIYGGAGGIGQAAIAIALKAGCRVYTTVFSQEQRDFLINRFPELPDSHIFYSLESSFEQRILQATKNGGVDLLFVSSGEHFAHVSTRCLAKYGRYLDLSTKISAGIFLNMFI